MPNVREKSINNACKAIGTALIIVGEHSWFIRFDRVQCNGRHGLKNMLSRISNDRPIG